MDQGVQEAVEKNRTSLYISTKMMASAACGPCKSSTEQTENVSRVTLGYTDLNPSTPRPGRDRRAISGGSGLGLQCLQRSDDGQNQPVAHGSLVLGRRRPREVSLLHSFNHLVGAVKPGLLAPGLEFLIQQARGVAGEPMFLKFL